MMLFQEMDPPASPVPPASSQIVGDPWRLIFPITSFSADSFFNKYNILDTH